jgi:hydroxypyruvate reductase
MTETRRGIAADCESIWRGALRRTQAAGLVRAALAAEPPPDGPVRLLAVGKAAPAMARAALAVLGARAEDPLVVAPSAEDSGSPPAPGGRAGRSGDPAGRGAGDALAGARVVRGSHPRPDAGSLAAGAAILEWAERGRGLPVLALVSGGGSALAVAPAHGIAFREKVDAVAALMRAGATIHELNALRKHLSRLKGGRLAALLAPAEVRVLLLSDVPGDDLSTIASGPFTPDPTTFADALRAVAERGAAVPDAVAARLAAGARGELEETPKPGDPRLARVSHRLLAGPVDLARAAAEEARALGFAAEADPAPLAGDVSAVASRLGAWARAHAGRGRRLLALGGEPTIAIPPEAPAPDGGRAQHLALAAAKELAGLRAAVLAAGSDGRDGPTDQAGAVVDGATAAQAAAAGVDLDAALAEARSGPAAVLLGAAIPREDTGTHLCDLVLVAVE